MDLSEVLDQADPAGSVVVAAFGVVGAGWAVRRFLHRPNLKFGIPPTEADRNALRRRYRDDHLGKPSLTRAFRHRRRCFALKLRGRDRSRLGRIQRWWLQLSRHVRCLRTGPDGLLRLPVLLLNDGSRAANDLSASIIIHTPGDGPTLRLVNVVTESLDCHIYASDRESLDDELAKKAAPSAIVGAYERDLDYATFQDGVWLSGALTAHTYELTYLICRPEPGLTDFFLIYTTNCDDGWSRASASIQACRVLPPEISSAAQGVANDDARAPVSNDQRLQKAEPRG